MSTVLTLTSPREYFRDLLGTAISHQRVTVEPETEFYLVNLLSEFLDSNKLFVQRDDGSLDTEPLALMLARALEGSRESQIQGMRKLGDVSLYMSGFFSDALSRQVVDIDYYIGMGGAAYARVAELIKAQGAAALYAELSQKFNAYVDLLSEVAEKTAVTSNRGVVRLYERWIKTGSVRLARMLGQQGVLAQVPPEDGMKN
jgi:hypothetical protein